MQEYHVTGRIFIVRNEDRESASLVYRNDDNTQNVIETYYGSEEYSVAMCRYHFARNVAKAVAK